MRKVIMGAAAAAMLAGSSMANAAPVAREASPTAKAEALRGGELWLALLAAGLLIFLLFAINGENDETLPHSP